jgi:hypothetical protein
MKIRLTTLLCSAIIFAVASTGALGQEKTAKACREEWQAQKAAMQAAGKKEKEYVAECTGKVAAQPPATPSAAPAPAPAPAAPPPARQTAAPAAPAPTAAPARPANTGASAGTGQFANEAAAKAHCPSDTVVWANLDSRIYHFAGTHNYGTTKHGAYMCETETLEAGVRAAKNEKHP